jgi:asparagine synthase (glutamine-hydrolysing)
MCGIAGWLGPMADPERVAARLGRALRHRGPDGQDWRHWDNATLVHTRLRILDLSSAGSQPMANEDGSVWTVFNGEIYNHADERRLLERQGHRFRGRSDTEILPHLFEQYGAELARRLKGMFAWAVYQPATGSLLLARDRFGIKPLFYAADGRRLAFASELNALKQVPGVDTTPDPQAISDYLSLFCVPAPLTFYRGIRALPPGHLLEAHWRNGRLETSVRPFHSWTIATRVDLSFDDAVAQADALLQKAVERQLESDVPLGCLLSGGIDSSLVSSAAQAALGSLQTYNVRLPSRDYDETWAAHSVSQRIHSRHHTMDLQNFRGTWELVTDLLRHAGQPFADTSMFAANAVSRLMRRHVTVALSGDGGDEGFGGYALHVQMAALARLRQAPTALLRAGAALLTPAVCVLPIPAQLPSRLRLVAGVDDVGLIQAFRSWVRTDEHARLSRLRHVEPVRRWFVPAWRHELRPGASALERLSALSTEVDARLILPNDMLFKVDMSSMKESLEVRVPLLDEELFGFGLTLPHSFRATGRVGKRVLRGVAQRRLPADVASKQKRGFRVPVDDWVTSGFKTQLRQTLLSNGTSLPEVVDPAVYRPWVEAFCSADRVPGVTREGLYQRAMMLLSLHLALDA